MAYADENNLDNLADMTKEYRVEFQDVDGEKAWKTVPAMSKEDAAWQVLQIANVVKILAITYKGVAPSPGKVERSD